MYGHPLGYNFLLDSLKIIEDQKIETQKKASVTKSKVRKTLQTKKRIPGLRVDRAEKRHKASAEN